MRRYGATIPVMKWWLGWLFVGALSACTDLAQLAVATPTPVGLCWFLEDETIGQEGYTTLGQLGMGGQGGQWDRIEVYHWITADRIDLRGGAEMTRAVCTVTDDPAYIQAFDGGVGWNEYPVIDGMPDWNDDPP